HMNLELTRAKLEQMTDDLVQATLGPIRQALTDAKVEPEGIDKILLVGGATRMPMIQDIIRAMFGKVGDKSINPDECVALGAAAQAGVLSGEVTDILLLDVTPLTLGIETLGGVATPLIDKNTTIPTRKSQIFSTAADNQPSVEIHVLQGERAMAADNKTLGRFMLDGIIPAPRGMPQVEVTFDIDANGIASVKAQDKGTGKEQKIVITASSGLSKEEVERMQRDAEAYAADDAKRREEVETRNAADTLAYTAEKTLREQGDKVPADLKQQTEEKIANVRSALQGSDIAEVQRTMQELSGALQQVGAAVYQAPPGAETPPGEEEPPKTDEGTVEGEFREV
ncbi:MAG: Hsp70 family protein, partial [Dehalococcoidia bacterium]|nr:Hsp70 family protein [Dehalococcoidia bacterium]